LDGGAIAAHADRDGRFSRIHRGGEHEARWEGLWHQAKGWKCTGPPSKGEVRGDGLTLTQASHHLEIEWRARDVHPWDRGSESEEREVLFTEESLADSDAALSRLFNKLPEIDVIRFRVIHPHSDQRILAGTVERSACLPSTRCVSPRTRLWHRGVTTAILALGAFALVSVANCAQVPTTNSPAAPAEEAAGFGAFEN